MSETEKLAAEIVEFGKRLNDRGYICASEGNLSARLSDGRIMITPANKNKGFLKPSDLVICDLDGDSMENSAEKSSEFKLHQAVYKNRPDISAVCHAHPLYATSFSVAALPLNKAVLPEIVGTLGGIPLVPYAPPGSDKLAENLKGFLNRYDAFLLESHGVVTIGRSSEEAFNRMEMTEKFAAIMFNAERLGKMKLLDSRETERLLKAAGRLSIKSEIECRK